MAKKMRADGMTEEEVKAKIADERAKLQGEMTKNKDKMDLRDKH